MKNLDNRYFDGFVIDQSRPIVQVRFSGAEAKYKPIRGLHQHTHYEILLIKRGGGEHIIDYHSYPVVDNQVFFLRPGQVHQFKPSTQAEFYFVAFDSNAIQLNSVIQLNQFEFFQSFNTLGYVVIQDIDPVIEIIKSLMEDTYQSPPFLNQNTLVCSYLMIFLIKLQREFIQSCADSGHTNKTSDIVKEFNRLVDDSTCCYRFVHDYAKQLHVSPNYLNESVKRETGKPVSYWIYDKLLLESKRRLLQTQKSIYEIATDLQFPDATHFSRFFKRYAGTTPKLFRLKML